MKKSYIKAMAEYCHERILDFDLRRQVALGYMERMRCPLRVAGGGLYDEIYDLMAEWCEDNDLDLDNILDDAEEDVEEVFYAIED